MVGIRVGMILFCRSLARQRHTPQHADAMPCHDAAFAAYVTPPMMNIFASYATLYAAIAAAAIDFATLLMIFADAAFAMPLLPLRRYVAARCSSLFAMIFAMLCYTPYCC